MLYNPLHGSVHNIIPGHRHVFDFNGGCLGYLPVLAKLAAQVAPGTREGERICPGKDIEKRLFFNGIDVNRAR